MTFKTYTAPTVAEAVSLVKKDLGTRAVILHTRTVSKRMFLGLWKRDFFEITAGPEGSAVVPDRGGSRDENLADPSALSRRGTSSPSNSTGRSGSNENVLRENKASRLAGATKQQADARLTGDTYTPSSVRQAGNRSPITTAGSVASNPPERAIRPNATGAAEAMTATGGLGKDLLASPAASTAAMAGMSQELSELKSLVTKLVVNQRANAAFGGLGAGSGGAMAGGMGGGVGGGMGGGMGGSRFPEELFEYYLKLVENQVADVLAGEIVSAVQLGLRPDQMKNRALVRARVLEQLEKLLPCESAGCMTPPKGKGPAVLMLVGPTGVGKTTTLAKLAAHLQLKQGKRVSLITLDTYRIAAVDQLRRYADILGCELRVVNTPEELEGAIASMGDVDQILIDSAGRSPRDVMKINELRRFVEAAKPTEVHLVLSATSSIPCIDLAVEKFAQVRVDRILLTKLDEASHFGVVLNVVRKVNKQISFLTTGQNVPDDIEASHPRRLAEAMLGTETAGNGLERRSGLQAGALVGVATGGTR